MWSYFGSKTNIVGFYPKPKESKIIEPFAGSARYALQYFEKDVLLVDAYPVIIKIWHWLQKCSEADVKGLPRFLKPGQTLDEFEFDCEEARLLMGFLICRGGQAPRNRVSDRISILRPNQINYSLKRIASNLYKIRHWDIRQGSYLDIPNQTATWFIDPPYQFGGHVYVHGNKGLDYSHLAEWCMQRQGQTIVCETTKADWMPFKPMAIQKGTAKGLQHEAIWSNHSTAFDNTQYKLNF